MSLLSKMMPERGKMQNHSTFVKTTGMSVTIKKFTFNGFQENTYVVHDESVAVIIDPGCYERREEEELYQYIQTAQLKVSAIILTHAHIDHVLGSYAVCERYKLPLTLHKTEVGTLQAVQSYAAVYGFPKYTEPKDDYILLEGNEKLEFGNIKMTVFFTPGHSVGHVVYYLPEQKSVINGDVLFQGSFGRVDLPGGDLETLKNSIYNVMFKLPNDTVIYCGHGPETTVGREKQFNFIHQF